MSQTNKSLVSWYDMSNPVLMTWCKQAILTSGLKAVQRAGLRGNFIQAALGFRFDQ